MPTAATIRQCLRPAAAGILSMLGPGTARASEGGLELMPDPWVLLSLLVLFGALVVPVNNLIFRPIFRVLDDREARTSGTRARAAGLEARVREVMERYEGAVLEVRQEAEQTRRELLEQARAESRDVTGRARGEAESEIERARDEITAALADARGGLAKHAEELAREAATRVLGRPVA